MQKRFRRLFVGMRQAQSFMDSNGELLKAVNSGGSRAEFDAVTVRIGALADTQEAHGTTAKGELANERKLVGMARRRHMWPLVRVARAKVPAAAQLSAVVLPPFKASTATTASHVRSMATAVLPYRQLLQEGGLAPDFIEQMHAAAAQMDQAVIQKRAHVVARSGATNNIRTEVAEARLQIGAVDALVRATVAETEPKIADWNKIMRDIRAALRIAFTSLNPAPTPVPPVVPPVVPVVPAPAPVVPPTPVVPPKPVAPAAPAPVPATAAA